MSPASGLSFRHVPASTRTFYGDNSIRYLASELDRLRCRRVVIFSGRSLAADSAVMDRLREAIGFRYAGSFDGVQAQSPLPAVIAGASCLQELKADAVVAVGGGSALVTARASSIILAEGGDVHALATQFPAHSRPISPKLKQAKIPQFAVPSTPTTAYAKAGSAVVDVESGRRLSFFDPKTRAVAIFFDTEVFRTAPEALFLDAALNSLSVAVQGIEFFPANSIADASLFRAYGMLMQNLGAYPKMTSNVGFRGELMLAALLAGQGSEATGGGILSALGHNLSKRCGVGAGVLGAILLPHTVRFNSSATSRRLADIAMFLGLPKTLDGAGWAGLFEELFQALSLPTRLRDVGVAEADLFDVAIESMEDWPTRQNPVKIEVSTQLGALLSAAW